MKPGPKGPRGMNLLTAAEHVFVREFAKSKNAEEAVRIAGITLKKGQTAQTFSYKNRIREALRALKAAAIKTLGLDAEWVLYRLYEELTADLADLYDEHGALKPVDLWPTVWRTGLVSGVDSEEMRNVDGEVIGVVKKLRLSDRTKRIELLGKHIGIRAFEDRVIIPGLSDLADRLARARARIEAEPRVINGDADAAG